MANVSHASLTGSQLHEPKGADTAALGTVYVSNGAGSGSWSSVGTSSFTGMIADFVTPTVPTGWLELDGSTINTTTYSALYGTMTIQTTGTRSNGSAIITSLPSTTDLRVGYYVFGTGFSSGTTIVSIDSSSQITVSNTATSSGSAGALAISPWLLNTGTIKLPDVSTAGRYRRSRTSSTAVGQLQADQNKAHTHTGTTDLTDTSHTHSFSATTGTMSANATHTHTVNGGTWLNSAGGVLDNSLSGSRNYTTPTLSTANTDHTHSVSGTTGAMSANSTHTHTFTTASSGSSEARPLSIVVMTCVKI